MSMNIPPVEIPRIQPQVQTEKEINPLDLESIIKPNMSEASTEPMGPEIPSDADIEDILVA